MPIGPLELAIVVVILLIFFGYRWLPALGRSAGKGVRQLKGSAEEMVGDKVNPSTLGKSAGKGVREAREFRDALTGKGSDKPAREPGNSSSKPAPSSDDGPGEPSRQRGGAIDREGDGPTGPERSA